MAQSRRFVTTWLVDGEVHTVETLLPPYGPWGENAQLHIDKSVRAWEQSPGERESLDVEAFGMGYKMAPSVKRRILERV